MPGKTCGRLPLLLCVILVSAGSAERLPMRQYSTDEGLANDHVSRIRPDSQGFLWFCTDDGLSKWDGYRFKTYTTSDGLPHSHVDDLIETRIGEYWIATDAGLALFHPNRLSMPFSVYLPGTSSLSRAVNILAEDRDGAVLLGTGDGLYRLVRTALAIRITREEIGLPKGQRDGTLVNALLLTRAGIQWVGAGSGLYYGARDGHWSRLSKANGLPENFINQLREDAQGRVWAGTRGGGLVQLNAGSKPDRVTVAHVFTHADGLPSDDVRDLLISRDGHLWVGTNRGLAESPLDAYPRLRFRTHPTAEGFAEQSVYWFSEDQAGNIWFATSQIGAIRIARQGFHTYAEADGFFPQEVNDGVETRDGNLCIVNGNNSRRLIQCFDGQRFSATALRTPFHRSFGYEWNQFAIQDRLRDWWFAAQGAPLKASHVKRPSDFAQARCASVSTTARNVRHLFQDSRGVIWMGQENSGFSSVSRWNPASRTSEILWRQPYTPTTRRAVPSYFLEDRTGQVWVGLSGEAGLLRWRRNRFEAFGTQDGLPAGEITAMYSAPSGELWIASKEGGLGHISDPAGDQLHARLFTRATGLSSNEIWCVTGDRDGRIYAGTSRGVEVLEPATGHVMHYTAEDGLVRGYVRTCFRDRAGELWFVTNRGISRFAPPLESSHRPPRVLITEFRVRGVPWEVAQVGVSQIGPLELAPSRNQIAIDFVGINDRLRPDLRYQYRLLGAESGWSNPASERSVTFDSLVPGRYQFEVRALDANGAASFTAFARFVIRPPLWQRWWFLCAGALAAAAMIYSLFRHKLEQKLALERVRSRIATDLHDDIGAGLSRIAIISEVLRLKGNVRDEEFRRMLGDVAENCRNLIDGMSDIVWSLDTRSCSLEDVVIRIRQYATLVLDAKQIHWEFCAPANASRVPLSYEHRRHLLLIFKESIHNSLRHSGCSFIRLRLELNGSRVKGEICDDGSGGVLNTPAGHGIRNLHSRAAALGGKLELESGEGTGTRVSFSAPLITKDY